MNLAESIKAFDNINNVINETQQKLQELNEIPDSLTVAIILCEFKTFISKNASLHKENYMGDMTQYNRDCKQSSKDKKIALQALEKALWYNRNPDLMKKAFIACGSRLYWDNKSQKLEWISNQSDLEYRELAANVLNKYVQLHKKLYTDSIQKSVLTELKKMLEFRITNYSCKFLYQEKFLYYKKRSLYSHRTYASTIKHMLKEAIPLSTIIDSLTEISQNNPNIFSLRFLVLTIDTPGDEGIVATNVTRNINLREKYPNDYYNYYLDCVVTLNENSLNLIDRLLTLY